MIKYNIRAIKVIFFLIISFSSLSAQEPIRILAIGNSFSQDAAESYLDDLAKADGVKLIIGNMYIGGCSMETHWNNAQGNLSAYSYRKITEGDSTTRANQSLLAAIKDEDWDIITFQQVSQSSGQQNTYFPYLTNLLQYVKNEATNPNVKFALHQTWAYASNSTHSGFVNYNKDQMQMYQAIVDAINSVSNQTGIDIIIPAGTAIQNGRSSYIGDNFCRDGYHLTYGIGRYTAACVWYEKLLERTVIGNSFIPVGMSGVEASLAQHAAHYAILKPNEITSLADFNRGEAVELTLPVNIDFGATLTSSPWNNLSSMLEGASLSGLTDSAGNVTTVSITVNDRFGGPNANGSTTTTTALNLPGNATRDSFWGNAAGVFSGESEKTGGFLISGLTTSQSYDFHMFASRTSASDNRETYFTVTGRNEQTVLINASNNTSTIASAVNIQPADNGTVSIKVGAGSNNTNEYKFFYINSLTIAPSTTSGLISFNETSYRLYPNPVKSVLLLESEHMLRNVEIFDVSGKKVFAAYNLKSNREEFDLTSLLDGYYFLRFNNKCIPLIKRN